MRIVMTVALSVVSVAVARWLWRTVRNFLHALTNRQARKQLEDLNELVAAWQLANRDEVQIMNDRIVAAQGSLAEATRSARDTALYLTNIEQACVPESG